MNDSTRHFHIFVLTGPVQGGKTTLVSEKVSLLREKGVKVLGFLCPGSFSEGKRSAFSLVDIETGRQVPMGDANEQKAWVKFRRFYFNPEAFVQVGIEPGDLPHSWVCEIDCFAVKMKICGFPVVLE